MKISYQTNKSITSEEFVELLKESTLAERKPIEDTHCMDSMVKQ